MAIAAWVATATVNSTSAGGHARGALLKAASEPITRSSTTSGTTSDDSTSMIPAYRRRSWVPGTRPVVDDRHAVADELAEPGLVDPEDRQPGHDVVGQPGRGHDDRPVALEDPDRRPIDSERAMHLGHDGPQDGVTVERGGQPLGDPQDRLQAIGQERLVGGLAGSRCGGPVHRRPKRQRRDDQDRQLGQDRGVDHGPLAALDGPRQEGQDDRGQPDGDRPAAGQEGRREEQGHGCETDPERVVGPGPELDRRVADQCGDRDQGRAERAGHRGGVALAWLRFVRVNREHGLASLESSRHSGVPPEAPDHQVARSKPASPEPGSAVGLNYPHRRRIVPPTTPSERLILGTTAGRAWYHWCTAF